MKWNQINVIIFNFSVNNCQIQVKQLKNNIKINIALIYLQFFLKGKT